MVTPSLEPGFRFHPTDVELVGHYLHRKVTGQSFYSKAVSEIELYKYAPWDLPEKSLLGSGYLEWYFFCPRDRKYPNGTRINRHTAVGYWKSTGKDRRVIDNSSTIGMKKTLVFHSGKAPKGTRTDWVMHEYRLADEKLVGAGFSKDAFVVCKIFNKSGADPNIAEDPTSVPHPSSPSSTLLDNPGVSSNVVLELPASSGGIDVQSNSEPSDDGFYLEEFLNVSLLEENDLAKIPDSEVPCRCATQASTSEPQGIFDGLEDLPADMLESEKYSQGIFNEYGFLPMLSDKDFDQYLELNDSHYPLEKYFPL